MLTNRTNTPFRKPSLVMSLAMLLLILISCNLPGMLTPTPIPSATPLPPLNTPTLPPPTPTIQPTSTTPTVTATASPANIVFATGATAGVAQGTIQPNQVITYTLSAAQNQPMILILDSPNHDVYLGVHEPDGTKLLDPAKKWTNWQWLLPKTEVYTIQVYGGAIAEKYTLTAKVAQIISFTSGETSITLAGSTPDGNVFSYALVCQTGQVMTVTLNVPASTAYLDVFGLATGTLLSSSKKLNTWTGTLPANEDYIIEVIPVGGQVVNYTITVSVN
ncbi:MAG: hypothetical protein WCE68_14090 [Anaerolineales bacterium]